MIVESSRSLVHSGSSVDLTFGYYKRLHSRVEYLRFFQESEVFRFPEVQIFGVKNQTNHFRVGITLKAKGSSVERNNIKRTIRESMRRMGPFLGTYDYNVVVPATKKLSRAYSRDVAACLLGKFAGSLRVS